MTRQRELETSLRWVRDGTELLLAGVDALDDGALVAPSGLPAWSRAHVIAHVGFNAVALMNLITWARTGEPQAMYESAARRDRDIEQGATWPAPRLRDLVSRTSTELEDGFASLDDRTWTTEVVTALGRRVAASQIPWMRTREVGIHAVDLRAGIEFTDLPDDLSAALILDAATRRTLLGRDPAVRLEADEGGSWHIGDDSSPISVAGPVAELAAWITGRRHSESLRSSHGRVPELTPWL